MNAKHQAVCLRALARGLDVPPPMTVSEWADEHRHLPKKGASEHGKWHTSRTPHLRRIMDVLSRSHPAKRICFKKSSQVGGTEAGNNWIGYIVHHAPGPMMIVQPTTKSAERWSKQRLAPMLDESPALKALISTNSRDSSNTTLLKEFPNGMLFIAGSNSTADLSSMPAKYLFCDEVDRYEGDIGEEGDPVELAIRRTTTFQLRRKIFLVSTPTIKGASRIDTAYEASNQEQYFVPCPYCGHKQTLKFKNLHWPKGEPKKALYHCEGCGVGIEEHHKTWMLDEANGAEWIATYPEREDIGFYINALYCPMGLGDTWGEIAKQFLAAKDDAKLLKVFTNTIEGMAFEAASKSLKWELLKNRAEHYKLRTIPPGALMLTMGVDTQDDRLEYIIVAFGRNETVWVIDYGVLYGDTSDTTSDRSPWLALDKLRATPIRNSFGVDMRIRMTAIDTGGHRTHEVYNYVRQRLHSHVIAIKGASQSGKPILGRPSKVDVTWAGQSLKHGAELWPVGTDTAKDTLFTRMEKDAECAIGDRRVHFPHGLDDEFYKMLTAEVYDPEEGRWVPRSGQRNEALDTFVYAYAAACHPHLNVNKMRESDWESWARVLEPHGDLFAPLAPPVDTDASAPAPVMPAPETITAPPTPPPKPAPSTDGNWLHVQDNWL